MPVCALCNSEKSQSLIASNGRGIIPKILAKTIREGCCACMMLRDGIQCFETLDPPRTLIERISLGRRSIDNALLVLVNSRRFSDRYDLEFTQTQAKTWTASNSMASLSWVQNQLQKCAQDHQHCHAASKSSLSKFPSKLINTNVATSLEPETTLPTRVLDIGNRAEHAIKLVETQGTMIGHYVCLSHCWGKKQPLVTTRENIEAWKVQIPSTMFPKTFHDAITFTKNLGIRYLWIDSLCIMQNDSQDWQQQAGKMAEIYENSYLTLAATASHNSDGGLFYDFSPRSKTHVLTGLGFSGEPVHYYVRKRTPHWSDTNTGEEPNLEADFPLLTRAWTYQERLLAPRVLHFCVDELVWECNEAWTCQCGSFNPSVNPKQDHAYILSAANVDRIKEKRHINYGEPVMQNEDSFFLKSDSYFTPGANALAKHKPHPKTLSLPSRNFTEETKIDEENPNSNYLYRTWRDVVNAYSKLNLTYENDRLPALAGLAQQMHRSGRDRYLAGLWENDLMNSLDWFSDINSIPRKLHVGRPTMHHPPTWSWASTNQVISFNRPTTPVHHLCAIDEVDCSPLDYTNPKGVVAHGYLVITGRLEHGKLGYHDGKWTFNIPTRMMNNDDGYWGLNPDYDFASPGPDQISEGQLVSCLPFCLEENGLRALVVICIDEEKKHYKRIGLLVVTHYPFGAAQLLPQWQPGEAELDSNVSDPRKECYLIEFWNNIREESWTAFIETFERDEINEIFPYRQGVFITVLVMMTLKRAEQVITLDIIRHAIPIPRVESRKKGCNWFLTAENAKRKERGEHYVTYFGEIITII